MRKGDYFGDIFLRTAVTSPLCGPRGFLARPLEQATGLQFNQLRRDWNRMLIKPSRIGSSLPCQSLKCLCIEESRSLRKLVSTKLYATLVVGFSLFPILAAGQVTPDRIGGNLYALVVVEHLFSAYGKSICKSQRPASGLLNLYGKVTETRQALERKLSNKDYRAYVDLLAQRDHQVRLRELEATYVTRAISESINNGATRDFACGYSFGVVFMKYNEAYSNALMTIDADSVDE